MKTIPVLLAMGVLIAGCGRAPVAQATEGIRAQKLAEAPVMQNEFVGVWSSPPQQTVNDWLVIFTDDGNVAIDGPGLKVDGVYTAHGGTATATFSVKGGKALTDQAEFALVDGQQIVLSTGVPGEAPVQLVRALSGVASMPKPSIRHTATDAVVNPVTLMALGL